MFKNGDKRFGLAIYCRKMKTSSLNVKEYSVFLQVQVYNKSQQI